MGQQFYAAIPTTIRRPEPAIPDGLHLCIARFRFAGQQYSGHLTGHCQAHYDACLANLRDSLAAAGGKRCLD